MTTWIVLLLIILAIVAYTAWNYFRIRRVAKFVDNETFESLIHQGQLIDVRESTAFKTKHILGARNLPFSQLQRSMTAIRKDKPVLLYDSSRGQVIPRAVLMLKKAGYTDLYVLRDGLDYWTGKVKEN